MIAKYLLTKQMNKKSIAIIGGNSFLGQSIFQYFPKDIFDCSIYSRYQSEGIQWNLFDYPANYDFNCLLSYDTIIFCIAAGNQNTANNSFANIIDVNCSLPLQLMHFLHQNNYSGKFFSFGSYFEIGINDTSTYFTEDEVINSNYQAANSYSLSKRLLSKAIASAFFNINYYHFILPTIFGKGEPGQRLIPYLISCIRAETSAQLTSGMQFRQYLFVKDLANILELFINQPHSPGIYNVAGNKDAVQIIDLVKLLYKKANQIFEPKSLSEQRYDAGMQFLAIDNTKFNMATNNNVVFTALEDALEDYYENN